MRQEFLNTRQARLGISLRGCFRRDEEDPFSLDAADAGCFSVFYVSSGAGEISVGKKSFFVTKGEAFVFRPGMNVSCVPDPGGPWSVYSMDFDGEDADFFLNESGFSSDVPLKKVNGAGFMSAVMNCLDMGEDTLSQARLTALLLEGISSLGIQKAAKRRVDPAVQVKKAISFIENNYMRGITAGDVALSLSIDRSHFFRIFKAKTGVSPEQYIMKCRVDNACRLLAGSESTVTEIASAVGVRDVYYFSKLFKKSTGMSPTEYRRAGVSEPGVSLQTPPRTF